MSSADNPLVKWVGQIGRWIIEFAVPFPAIDIGVEGKEIVHIPDYGQLARNITNILVLEREIFTI